MKETKHFICYHQEEGSFIRTPPTNYICATGYTVKSLNPSNMLVEGYMRSLYKRYKGNQTIYYMRSTPSLY